MLNKIYSVKIDKAFLPKYKYKLDRVGHQDDGGYFVPTDSLREIDNILSFGINDDASFEIAAAKKVKGSTYCFDGSISTYLFVRQSIKHFLKLRNKRFITTIRTAIIWLKLSNRIKIYKKYLSEKKTDTSLSLADLKQCLPEKFFKSSKNLLKCDIEGCEIQLLGDFLSFKRYFSIMIFEFHNFDKEHIYVKDFINKLKFEIVALNINNFEIPTSEGEPKVIEIVLVRKTLLKKIYGRDWSNLETLCFNELDLEMSMNNPRGHSFDLKINEK